MKKKELQAIAQAAAKNIKTEEDLNEFRVMLIKVTVEAALNAELDDHPIDRPCRFATGSSH